MGTTVTLLLAGHALSVLSFAALFLLVLVGRRASPYRTTILLASGGTAIWSACTVGMSLALQRPVLVPILEWVNLAGWMWLTLRLLSAASPERAPTYSRLARFGVGVPLVTVVGFTGLTIFGINPVSPATSNLIQAMAFMGMIVFGLMLIETLARWMSQRGRSAARYYIVSVGFLFAINLFLYATMLLLGQIDFTIFAVRGLSLAFVPPMLAVALVREREWLVDIHISRQVVVNAATLIGVSVYLLVMAGVGFAVRELNSTWGPLLHVAFLMGAIILLVSIVSSEGLRPRLRNWISRNFFSAKYDYRHEWLRFSDALSADPGVTSVEDRVLSAILQSLNCRQGGLWLAMEANAGFALAAARPQTVLFNDAPMTELAGELMSTRKASGFDRGSLLYRSCPFTTPWAGVPILHRDVMVGFLVLSDPIANRVPDEEDFELLRVLCAQAAAHLVEERSAAALGRAERFEGTARRLTYIGHDLKNIVSQISLALQNWSRHSGNPEFVQQMPIVLKGTVDRMKRLLEGLKDGSSGAEVEAGVVDVGRCLASMLPVWRARHGNLTFVLDVDSVLVRCDAVQIESVFDQLVSNAMDASGADGEVVISAGRHETIVWSEISDRGAGIGEQAVADSRFGSVRSAKPQGFGVGLFQIRDYVRRMGGTLTFSSVPGGGTTARLELPIVSDRAAQPASRPNLRIVGGHDDPSTTARVLP